MLLPASQRCCMGNLAEWSSGPIIKRGMSQRRTWSTKDYPHELVSYALNAALAMNDIMEFTQDGCAEHITSASTLAGDSLYLYLSSLEDSVVSSPEEDSQIASHPLMQRGASAARSGHRVPCGPSRAVLRRDDPVLKGASRYSGPLASSHVVILQAVLRGGLLASGAPSGIDCGSRRRADMLRM